MHRTFIHAQQNLHDLGVGQEALTNSKRSFHIGILSKAGTLRNAASSLASKIRKSVKPANNTSGQALFDTQELTEFITTNQELWEDFRTQLAASNVVTNAAVRFFLLSYISERREDLELMLHEYKKKKKEDESSKQSSGVKFMRRIRASTESITNFASTSIRNIQQRASFNSTRRNCGSETKHNHFTSHSFS